MMTNRRNTMILAAVLAVGTLFGAVACQQYVNIPAQTGDVASANANGSQVRHVIGESLRGLRPESLAPGTYQIILPNGSTPATYEEVLAIAGERFTWADAKGSGNVVDQLEIRSIRIRGLDATVDIIRSSQPGDKTAPRQLVTVYLKNYVIGGWGTQRVRVWRMSVADALEISAGLELGSTQDAQYPDEQPQVEQPKEEQPKEEQPIETKEEPAVETPAVEKPAAAPAAQTPAAEPSAPAASEETESVDQNK